MTRAELIERVRAADYPTADLFRQVNEAIGGFDPRADFGAAFWRFIANQAWNDAALALVERVLPGWKKDIISDPRHNDFENNLHTKVRLYERLNPRSIRKPRWGADDRSDDNIALALIAALLTALEDEDPSHG